LRDENGKLLKVEGQRLMRRATRLTSNRASDALKQNEFTPLVKLNPAARVMWRREENLTPPNTSGVTRIKGFLA